MDPGSLGKEKPVGIGLRYENIGEGFGTSWSGLPSDEGARVPLTHAYIPAVPINLNPAQNFPRFPTTGGNGFLCKPIRGYRMKFIILRPEALLDGGKMKGELRGEVETSPSHIIRHFNPSVPMPVCPTGKRVVPHDAADNLTLNLTGSSSMCSSATQASVTCAPLLNR
ncbi:hypothetical protein P7K49_028778 [Saguinus oedipus]|uniref:Uncharacterized protein n=1 Tax=Saguinus oedipus TaxID=9490 RepID=A0ABQ9U645_SAGOE|nr:hypothetical protein P7K49_028778 [Saguinus oedipus]